MSSPDPDHIFLESKKECTALALSASGGEGTFLVAGSRDGVIRVYQPPSTKVVRAVNGFGDEISSIAISPLSPTSVKAENGGDGPALRFWVASGRKVFFCDLGVDTSKLILSPSDARETLVLLEEEDDLLNQISLNTSGTKLAFTSDSGVIGIVDLVSENHDRQLLDPSHTSISHPVEFIPGWPTEGGGGSCGSSLGNPESG
ncbi:hypothetical protein FRC04_010765 [Tulasnella sp. 424]|nr:hypothetical protein FRC04_010765 [Tulasnella sp. 424]KAG8969291.1 hypothetical protein FRC05_001151 [Tulasnella sp. 425]